MRGQVRLLRTSGRAPEAHRAPDEAVANAYGWGDLFKDRALRDALPEWIDGAEDEILARLFRLNQERAEAEASA